jgi:hypothetical protein
MVEKAEKNDAEQVNKDDLKELPFKDIIIENVHTYIQLSEKPADGLNFF